MYAMCTTDATTRQQTRACHAESRAQEVAPRERLLMRRRAVRSIAVVRIFSHAASIIHRQLVGMRYGQYVLVRRMRALDRADIPFGGDS